MRAETHAGSKTFEQNPDCEFLPFEVMPLFSVCLLHSSGFLMRSRAPVGSCTAASLAIQTVPPPLQGSCRCRCYCLCSVCMLRAPLQATAPARTLHKHRHRCLKTPGLRSMISLLQKLMPAAGPHNAMGRPRARAATATPKHLPRQRHVSISRHGYVRCRIPTPRALNAHRCCSVCMLACCNTNTNGPRVALLCVSALVALRPCRGSGQALVRQCCCPEPLSLGLADC